MSVEKKAKGNTRPRQFRLGEDVMARLARIAAHLTRTTGVKHSRADAIRAMSKEKDEEIRSPKGASK